MCKYRRRKKCFWFVENGTVVCFHKYFRSYFSFQNRISVRSATQVVHNIKPFQLFFVLEVVPSTFSPPPLLVLRSWSIPFYFESFSKDFVTSSFQHVGLVDPRVKGCSNEGVVTWKTKCIPRWTYIHQRKEANISYFPTYEYMCLPLYGCARLNKLVELSAFFLLAGFYVGLRNILSVACLPYLLSFSWLDEIERWDSILPVLVLFLTQVELCVPFCTIHTTKPGDRPMQLLSPFLHGDWALQAPRSQRCLVILQRDRHDKGSKRVIPMSDEWWPLILVVSAFCAWSDRQRCATLKHTIWLPSLFVYTWSKPNVGWYRTTADESWCLSGQCLACVMVHPLKFWLVACFGCLIVMGLACSHTRRTSIKGAD